MLKPIHIIIFFLLLALFTNKVWSEEKVAFVDLNYVYTNSKIGIKINKEIQTKQKNINKEFDELQKKFDKEKKTLIAQKNVLSEDEYKKKILKLEENLKKYNKAISKKNKDLIDFRKKSKNEFALNLRSTLENYAKKNKISMILRKEQLLLGEKNLDITVEILELFNKN